MAHLCQELRCRAAPPRLEPRPRPEAEAGEGAGEGTAPDAPRPHAPPRSAPPAPSSAARSRELWFWTRDGGLDRLTDGRAEERTAVSAALAPPALCPPCAAPLRPPLRTGPGARTLRRPSRPTGPALPSLTASGSQSRAASGTLHRCGH